MSYLLFRLRPVSPWKRLQAEVVTAHLHPRQSFLGNNVSENDRGSTVAQTVPAIA